MIVLSFFAFLSGIVTILSPCILPVLPLILSGSVGGKRKPLGVVTGFVLSFTVFTLLLSTLVQALNIAPDTLRWAAVIMIIGFGLVLLLPPLQKAFELFTSRLLAGKQKPGKSGFTGGVVLGSSLGLVWTPCVGPIMASVISLAITSRIDGGSVIIVLSYSLGTALPMLAVMAGGRSLLKKVPGLKRSTGRIQKVFAMVMIFVGLAIGFDLDRAFQTMILRAFPSYGSGLTALEMVDPVSKALDRRRAGDDGASLSGGQLELSWQNPPAKGELGDYGPAPEILTTGAWFNSPPLTMEDLKGKVVLVDFWTYSCINCIRTIPYLKMWHEKYADRGLVILGVHSPEFAFERNEDNLRKAAEDLGVIWPVVQDNGFVQWQAYNNRYWPAHYFIDAEGRIRYYHFGEGDYEVSEMVIRELLAEAGSPVSEPFTAQPLQKGKGGIRTPEIYLGYGISSGFRSGGEDGEYPKDESFEYTLPGNPGPDEWGLEGRWTVRDQFIESSGEGSLSLRFSASEVFLVVQSLEEGSRIKIKLDGVVAGDTEDVFRGQLEPDENRLYKILKLKDPSDHLLKLDVEGRVRLYAFTFG